jgi:hypothetical protein
MNRPLTESERLGIDGEARAEGWWWQLRDLRDVVDLYHAAREWGGRSTQRVCVRLLQVAGVGPNGEGL